jgi:hypothetical protein
VRDKLYRILEHGGGFHLHTALLGFKRALKEQMCFQNVAMQPIDESRLMVKPGKRCGKILHFTGRFFKKSDEAAPRCI